jgi:hypothetical protein
MLWADTNKQGGGNDRFAGSDRLFIDTDLDASDRFMFEAKALWHGAWIERVVLCNQRLCAGGLAT